MVQAWDDAGSWDGRAEKVALPAPPLDAPAPAADRMKIADAIAAFLAIREGSKIAPPTLRKYRTFTKQLRAFSDDALGPRRGQSAAHARLTAGAFEDRIRLQMLKLSGVDVRVECAVDL
jgi:hypothetical protein